MILFSLAVSTCRLYLCSLWDALIVQFKRSSNTSANLWRLLSWQQRVIIWQPACQLLNNRENFTNPNVHKETSERNIKFIVWKQILTWWNQNKDIFSNTKSFRFRCSNKDTHLFRVYSTTSVEVLKWCNSISICSLYMLRHIGLWNLLHNSAYAEISFHNTFFRSHFLTASSIRVKVKPRARQRTVNWFHTSYIRYFESLLDSHLCRQTNT